MMAVPAPHHQQAKPPRPDPRESPHLGRPTLAALGRRARARLKIAPRTALAESRSARFPSASDSRRTRGCAWCLDNGSPLGPTRPIRCIGTTSPHTDSRSARARRSSLRCRACSHRTSSGSAARDCCSLTKGVLSGSLLDGPITCELDDRGEPNARSSGTAQFACLRHLGGNQSLRQPLAELSTGRVTRPRPGARRPTPRRPGLLRRRRRRCRPGCRPRRPG
jgi:hypothetical protein